MYLVGGSSLVLDFLGTAAGLDFFLTGKVVFVRTRWSGGYMRTSPKLWDDRASPTRRGHPVNREGAVSRHWLCFQQKASGSGWGLPLKPLAQVGGNLKPTKGACDRHDPP